VTPTSISKGLVKASDMVIVGYDGRLIAGSRNVTSEISMHLAIYQQRPDVSAVVHSHPPVATAFACSGRSLDEILCQEAVMTVGAVPLASYATTGTAEVAASMWPYITDHDAILLENHGVVSYGKTLLEAFMKMETVEHLANVAFVAHQLGSARPLTSDRIEQLQRARARYAQTVQNDIMPPAALKERAEKIGISRT
jgi:L-fuculose-phosphate aldolase